MVLEHIATRDGKLVSFLRRELELSSTLTTKLKYRDAYRVNGERVHVHHRVHPGDKITVTIEEETPDYPAQEGPLSILYEDESLLVLDKPAGIMMHPTFNRTEGTLANYLLYYYQQTGQKSAIHLVNRLDRDTFGVVLIAKNSHTHAILCEALQSGNIKKTYLGGVYGHPENNEGTIIAPIARLDPMSLLRCVREDGQYAETHYKVLERTEHCSLLELHPITGRTHQLRVHCCYMGWPMLGDSQYDPKEAFEFSQKCGYEYQQLCAAELSFPHPLTKETITVRSKQTITLPE